MVILAALCRRHKFSFKHSHQQAHNYLQLQFQGIQFPLLASAGTRAQVADTLTDRHTHRHAHELKEILKKKKCVR